MWGWAATRIKRVQLLLAALWRQSKASSGVRLCAFVYTVPGLNSMHCLCALQRHIDSMTAITAEVSGMI